MPLLAKCDFCKNPMEFRPTPRTIGTFKIKCPSCAGEHVMEVAASNDPKHKNGIKISMRSVKRPSEQPNAAGEPLEYPASPIRTNEAAPLDEPELGFAGEVPRRVVRKKRRRSFEFDTSRISSLLSLLSFPWLIFVLAMLSEPRYDGSEISWKAKEHHDRLERAYNKTLEPIGLTFDGVAYATLGFSVLGALIAIITSYCVWNRHNTARRVATILATILNFLMFGFWLLAAMGF